MVVHSRIRLADCGPFKSRFSADFMSASRPKPDIQLELLERSAVDPKRTSSDPLYLAYTRQHRDQQLRRFSVRATTDNHVQLLFEFIFQSDCFFWRNPKIVA